MFRFTIRDLLWLTLVVAVGLGWLAHGQDRENTYRAELDRANDRATKWRQAAGAVEHFLKQDGYRVTWQPDLSYVCLTSMSNNWTEINSYLDITAHEPSLKE